MNLEYISQLNDLGKLHKGKTVQEIEAGCSPELTADIKERTELIKTSVPVPSPMTPRPK